MNTEKRVVELISKKENKSRNFCKGNFTSFIL